MRRMFRPFFMPPSLPLFLAASGTLAGSTTTSVADSHPKPSLKSPAPWLLKLLYMALSLSIVKKILLYKYKGVIICKNYNIDISFYSIQIHYTYRNLHTKFLLWFYQQTEVDHLNWSCKASYSFLLQLSAIIYWCRAFLLNLLCRFKNNVLKELNSLQLSRYYTHSESSWLSASNSSPISAHHVPFLSFYPIPVLLPTIFFRI